MTAIAFVALGTSLPGMKKKNQWDFEIDVYIF
jgi:hypothetical protein